MIPSARRDPASKDPDKLPTLEARREARLAARKKTNRQKERDKIKKKMIYKKQRHAKVVFITTLPDDLLEETYNWALARYKETKGGELLTP